MLQYDDNWGLEKGPRRRRNTSLRLILPPMLPGIVFIAVLVLISTIFLGGDCK